MFSQIFIDRPRLAIVISIVTVLLGLLCLKMAPVAEYPEIAPPSLIVLAKYTGAGSQEVANTVATVIEEQMNGLEDMMYFSSSSSNSGSYMLTITFKSGTNTDIAQVNVQNAVERAKPLLPQIVKDNGIRIFKRSSDMLGMYAFTTDGSKLSLTELSNYIRTNVRDPLARVDGISDVMVMGERNFSMRIWLDSLHLSALNMKPEDVVQAIRSQNIQAAAGSVGDEHSNDLIQLKVNALGRLNSEEEFGNIVVKTTPDGRVVRLRDVARIELGAENYSNDSTFNGKKCVSLIIYRNDDANAIEVVDRANALLADLAESFPAGVEYTMGYDPTKYIRITMTEIAWTLILTLILVVAITYLFLQDWRATLIPSITIPVSLIGTFLILIPLGFSINLLTMFALILVIGSLVDDAIVVTENTMRIMETDGVGPKEAASRSMKQITGAVIATTLVVVAIYAPIGFYGGMIGTIYMQFAVTMCFALCLSTVNALTLSPALCAVLLRKPHPTHNPVFKIFNFCLDKSRKGYMFFTAILVRRLVLTAIFFAVVLLLNWHFYANLPSSFLPPEDKGALMATIELPPGATLTRTYNTQEKFREQASKIPGVKDVVGITGYSFVSGAGENVGSTVLALDDWEFRETPELQIEAIHQKAQQIASMIPEAKINVFQPPAIMGLGVTGGVSFMLQATAGQDARDMETAVRKFIQEINMQPETMIAFTNFEASTPQLFLDIDRLKAEAMGVPVSRIFSTLQGKLASVYVNDFNLMGYSFKVKIQAEASERDSVEDINHIMVQNNKGKMVPLSSFTTLRYIVGAQLINRFNQYLSASVNALAKPGYSSSQLMKRIEQIAAHTLGPDYRIAWTDMSRQERENEGRILVLLTFACLFGYLFLVGQYESWTIPLPVMLSIAFAMLGGLVGMTYAGLDLNIYAQLGLIMLIGLASKNAILMVEFSRQERDSGKTIFESAQEGFSQRYRAVLMTAWSFVIGVFPMVIATGAGAASRRAIGGTTFYGMLFSTIVGIAFIPPLYALFQRIAEKCSFKKSK